MAQTCDQRNPLTRSGTNQTERALAWLDPSTAKIDERELADRLVFAERYSRLIRFYDKDNQAAETWLPFFSKDVSATLALLAQLPYASFVDFSRTLRTWLAEDPSRDAAQLKNHFRLLFHLPLLLLKEAGMHYASLPIGTPLRGFMLKAVARDLASPLKELIGFAKGAWQPDNDITLFDDTGPDAADYNTTFDDGDTRVQLPGVVTERLDNAMSIENLNLEEPGVVTPGLDELLAGIDAGGWDPLYASVAANARPYADNAGNPYADITDALEYGAFTKTFDRIFQLIERITVEAKAALTDSLAQNDHSPHYGLWLAFLQMLEENRNHLNELTGDHREFYYESVLQFARRNATPDRAHLLFELSTNADDHLLTAGTRFKAGKDDLKKAVVYALDEDFVVNRAQVAELRALYRPTVDSAGTLAPVASTVANSQDGAGEARVDESFGWAPFGPEAAAPARIGFAISDRKLFLREGTRTITLTATLAEAGSDGFVSNSFKASLTDDEGWHAVEASDLTVQRTDDTLTLTIVLDGDAPAIIPYDTEIHGDEFSVSEPVLRIEFALDADDTAGAASYTELRDATFTKFDLSVSVTGCRNFSVRNDLGVIDATKPFLPFGSSPAVGAGLIVGSSEVFSKPLDTLTLQIDWAQALNTTDFFLGDATDTFTVSIGHLKTGTWKSLVTGRKLFDDGHSKELELLKAESFGSSIDQDVENAAYANSSRAGLIRLVLQKSFGHAEYTDQKTLALIAAAGGKAWVPGDYQNDGKLPYEPYTPTVVKLELDYTSSTDAPNSFLHLLPFGHAAASARSGRLFPDLAYEGELYIALDDLEPSQKLSLLFQVVDGTANALKSAPEIAWHYLRGNEWCVLEGQTVDDKTNDLTGSGVVGIAVPDDADTTHDLLPSGRHWIRLAATADADALNDLLSIDAQAATVTFSDNGNDLEFVATPLPAGTISKLETSDSSIKKITQPYESFGGRGKESEEAFPIRVSERLRHKDRASSMWDYERLVLESFPSVYKIKCINHTELCRDPDRDVVADNELKPGHVLVVAVPYVSVDGPVDPLRPYTDTSTLEAIEELLKERMSPFVQLEVQNPKIEAVQVDFTVAFTDEVADITFYIDKLSDAIRDYLTPWAHKDGAEISFGGKWYKSAIIDFVEEQQYVDYVKDFRMYHKPDIDQSDDDWTLARVDVETIQATTARSILVSHESHTIEEVS